MEMCITNQVILPPPTIAYSPERVEEVRAQELQLASHEKQQILEFKSQLATASSEQMITEQSWLLEENSWAIRKWMNEIDSVKQSKDPNTT